MKQKQIMLLSIFVVAFFMLLLGGWYFFSQQKQAVNKSVAETDYDISMRDDAIGQNAKASTDYYTFTLSWSPAFCDIQRKRNKGELPNAIEFQCGNTQQFGWVIHGLWPQNANARRVSDHPRFCKGDLPALPKAVIEPYLIESPSARLLQGEWEKHGACAFENASIYFEKQRELYRSLVLPNYELPSRAELFKWLKKNNPQLRDKYLGASRSELFICYDLTWNVIDCPRN